MAQNSLCCFACLGPVYQNRWSSRFCNFVALQYDITSIKDTSRCKDKLRKQANIVAHYIMHWFMVELKEMWWSSRMAWERWGLRAGQHLSFGSEGIPAWEEYRALFQWWQVMTKNRHKTPVISLLPYRDRLLRQCQCVCPASWLGPGWGSSLVRQPSLGLGQSRQSNSRCTRLTSARWCFEWSWPLSFMDSVILF